MAWKLNIGFPTPLMECVEFKIVLPVLTRGILSSRQTQTIHLVTISSLIFKTLGFS